MDLEKFFYRDLLYYPVARVQAGAVKKYQAYLEKTQFQDRKETQSLQRHRLEALMTHARDKVPFFGDGRLARSSLRELDGVPFLEKLDLQNHHKLLRSTASLGRLASKTTGGSTGQPVTLWKTRMALAWELAATWRGYSWANVRVGDRQARFWGVPQDTAAKRKARVIDFVCNRVRVSAFHFNDEDMLGYVSTLNRTKPSFFYGYVSMLSEFARFLNRRNIKLDFPLTSVISTSEVLSDPDRALLQETFAAPVFNEYGSGELGTVAHECEHGAMHLSEENMIVEIFDGDRPCGEGETGELVVTELNNKSFPLIRYRTGDFASISERPCACGRTLRILENVQGRAYDFIRNSQGDMFHGEFIMYLFEDLRRQGANISQFQVIQEDLDQFLVRIVKDEGYDSSAEEVITRRIQSEVDQNALINFQFVTGIEREKSGKLRLIKGLG